MAPEQRDSRGDHIITLIFALIGHQSSMFPQSDVENTLRQENVLPKLIL